MWQVGRLGLMSHAPFISLSHHQWSLMASFRCTFQISFEMSHWLCPQDALKVAGVVCSETPLWRLWLFVAVLTSDPWHQLGIFSYIRLPTHWTIFSLFGTSHCELQPWAFQHTAVPHYCSFFPLWCRLWPSVGRLQHDCTDLLADCLPQTYKRVNFVPVKVAGEYYVKALLTELIICASLMWRSVYMSAAKLLPLAWK